MLNMPTIETMCMGCFGQTGADGICPICGYSETDVPSHQLRPRTILNGKYLLGKVLGEGGFGITYIGWDLNLNLKVAIKEYYPTGFVTREITAAQTVRPFTGTQGEFFLQGRDRFVDEARSLARFRSLPGIVSVNDFFLENGTAYIVMEYIEGQTLKSYLAQVGGNMPAVHVFDVMKPVMSSLSEVHKGGMIHRDISPDNIMISKEGTVKLLDFGAAREFADSGNKSLSVMLKPGFAPEEQYRSKGKQGPWTDVYALSATMYKMITGITPDESSERMRLDEVKKPSALGAALRPAQEAALMRGMAVLQENRFQSIAELCAALYDARTAGAASLPQSAFQPSPPTLPSAPEATSVFTAAGKMQGSATRAPVMDFLSLPTAIKCLGIFSVLTLLLFRYVFSVISLIEGHNTYSLLSVLMPTVYESAMHSISLSIILWGGALCGTAYFALSLRTFRKSSAEKDKNVYVPQILALMIHFAGVITMVASMCDAFVPLQYKMAILLLSAPYALHATIIQRGTEKRARLILFIMIAAYGIIPFIEFVSG